MSFIATLRTRCRHFLRGLFHRDQVEHELREELDGYLDMLAEQKRATGMSPREARRAARLEFGGIDKVTEEVRDVRLSAWVDSVVRDSRRCFLSLLRNLPFTGVAISTVALGIGASVAVFTLVNAVLLRRLPRRAGPDRSGRDGMRRCIRGRRREGERRRQGSPVRPTPYFWQPMGALEEGESAEGGPRTHTARKGHGILSPECLPVPPPRHLAHPPAAGVIHRSASPCAPARS